MMEMSADRSDSAELIPRSDSCHRDPPQTIVPPRRGVATEVTAVVEGSGSDLKPRLISFARAIGFDSCRVARCSAPAHAAEFRAWLQDGAAGEMNYMERGEEKRRDPQKVLPGARSVIVLALNYWQGDNRDQRTEDPPSPSYGAPSRGQRMGSKALTSNIQRPMLRTLSRAVRPTSKGECAAETRDFGTAESLRRSETAATGRIARYAWGEDYHDVVAAKLKKIDQFLSQLGGIQKCYVDTGPVLERDHAAQAGIGWHGKSTMLINPALGTWFFLAEILTTLELPPDAPQQDRCGRCDRCITACPTGAITAPHRLDARRCISYLTIEHKSAIPLEFRPLIGDRIFGCDDCLDACPWNRFAKVSRESAFSARAATVGMALRDYLQLGNEDFRALFRNSPIKRVKRRGFLRNVCVALGNVGDQNDLAALERAAVDPEPLIAEHAGWAIEQIRERARRTEPKEPD
jgi:epoxyqueuosine reductase